MPRRCLITLDLKAPGIQDIPKGLLLLLLSLFQSDIKYYWLRVSSKYTSSVWEYHKRAFSPNVIKIFFRKNYNIQFYLFSPHYNIYTALLKLSICIKRKLNVLHNKRARKQIANSALNSFNESRLWVDSLGTTYWKRFDSTYF